jgi:hypothetical protein
VRARALFFAGFFLVASACGGRTIERSIPDAGSTPLAAAHDGAASPTDAAGSTQASDASITSIPPSPVCLDGATSDAALPHWAARIVNLSPDAPALDVCVADGQGAFGKPLLAGLGSTVGVAYLHETAYLDLSGAAANGANVMMTAVVSGAVDCSAPVTPAAPIALASATPTTIAVMGDYTPAGSAPSLSLSGFPESRTPQGDIVFIRFVNAFPGSSSLDLGVVYGGQYSAIFGKVGFGQNGGVSRLNPDGYQAINMSGDFALRVSGSTHDALDSSIPFPLAGNVVTVFAVGGNTGAVAAPLGLVVSVEVTGVSADGAQWPTCN